MAIVVERSVGPASPSDAPPPAAPDRAPRRFACLDGYRGLAALTVLVYHVMGRLNIHESHPLLGQYTARLGNYGVTVFFLLSGFLLYRPFVLAHFESRPAPSRRTFYARRMARIVPAYWVALTAFFFVFGYGAVRGIGDGLTYYGFAQIYRPGGYAIGGLGVAWSLCVEMSFYLLLPVLAFAFARARLGTASLSARLVGQLVGLGALYGFSTAYKLWAVPQQDAYPVAHMWLPARLDLFALGMLLAVASAWIAVGGGLPRLVQRFVDSPWLCLLFAVELYWVFAQLHLPRGFEDETFQQTMLRYPFSGLSAFFLLIPGTLGNEDRGAVAGFLRSTPIAALGTISYGVYLWHTIWLEFVLRMAAKGEVSNSVWVVLPLVFMLTIASAAVSYAIVEKPILDLVHRWTGNAARSRYPAERRGS
jgi:peptidoglycan/LPS O-acetylase OafA/YrhL